MRLTQYLVLTLMTLNILNTKGRLPADHIPDPQSMPRVLKTTNQLLIESLLLLTMFQEFTTWVKMVTHIPTGIRNGCIRQICCNFTDAYSSHEKNIICIKNLHYIEVLIVFLYINSLNGYYKF